MNKQIEEMVKDLHEAQHAFDVAWTECFQNKGRLPERENVFYATHLYNAGYRKQSEGEWETRTAPITQCSVCGMQRNFETQYAWNYCPNCGAKMKGGAE